MAEGRQTVLLCDKAAMERSGAVAQGLSAINTYIGDNTPDDYVRMVRNDLMGLVREDLIFDLGCYVDDSVHLFEEWGLPIWKKSAEGKNLDGKKGQSMGTLKSGAQPVRTGKWQIMINGESYKRVVAEAAKLAWATTTSWSAASSSNWFWTKTSPTRSPARWVSPFAKTKSTSSSARP
jgi:adenylylsulfate reductase subunit A